jgi:SAM-dependent methyltransferase
MYSDDDAAALYDVLSPWDPERYPSDRFYDQLVMASDSVLDVGCGTGAMLAQARANGHRGRLAGIDLDHAALARARRRGPDIEWVAGTAADIGWVAEFELVTMVSHAFQCLVSDDELRASLAAIRTALGPDGLFAFETRHPQARAWLERSPGEVTNVVAAGGRPVRVWYEVEAVTGDVVTFTGTSAAADGEVLRTDRTSLRFLDVAPLAAFLSEAGLRIVAQYGDWNRGPVTSTSREIIMIARGR